MSEPIKMKFSFQALNEIKEVLGVDLMGEDGEAKKEELKPKDFQRVAQAAIRWNGQGLTDEQAAEQSKCVDLAEVLEAMEKSFRANKPAVSE